MTTTPPRTEVASNPWLLSLWIATALTVVAGLVTTFANADPVAENYSELWARLGPVLLTVGGVMTAGVMVAGAICWQLDRRTT